MSKLRSFLCLSFVFASAAHAANWPDHPTLRAVRAAQGPVVDGDLGDPAWQAAPEFTDFTQHDPDDGQPATMRTSVRIVYDDEAIYFGMMMHDPGKPTGLLARRDSFTQSDFVSINIDPQLDRLSGAAFTISPVNVQVDTVLYNDIGEDGSWDGVWDSATKVTPEGWIAEVRVPFSQLRFPDKPVHVWGLNITRRTVRNNEWVRIVNTKKGDTGFVSHFADIVGLEGIRRGRPLELVPYAVARSDVRSRFDRDNPLLEQQDHRADGGLDVKYALTSNLTLTGTINPDFGQVEVDPAVVNLSDFETFYPERRPFFTEGLSIFRFNDSPAPSHFNFISSPQLFYTRRIGRAPQVSPDYDYVDSPADATILGAAKITGKLPGGWSIGVLDALTDKEEGRYANDDGLRGRQEVEPMTNYFVSRITKELGSASRIGMLFTSVNRDLSDDSSSLRESSMTGGLDAYTSFAERSWVLEGSLTGSRVEGSAEAIRLTQRSSSRYYQRPDADHVELDPTRTSLDGWAGRAMLSRATGIWRPNVQLQAFSPGYETNDTGFMQRTDLIAGHALMQYVNPNPNKQFRDRNVWFGTYQTYNFDADAIDRGWFVDAFGTFTNYWTARAAIFAGPGSFSDRQTRGGPLVRTSSNWAVDASIGSDSRQPFTYGLNGHADRSADGSYSRSAGIALTARPASNIQLSLEPSYSRSYTAHQYVDQFDDATATRTYGRRYVFAELQQHAFELGTRVDWTLRSNLSFQLYLQPFLAAGDYEHFSSLAEPRTRDYAPYAAYDDNPDFNFRSVRGSAVVRWEFRPGSALYVVWNENRAEAIGVGDFRFGRDVRAIPNAPSHDVFLVKLSYWLPM